MGPNRVTHHDHSCGIIMSWKNLKVLKFGGNWDNSWGRHSFFRLSAKYILKSRKIKQNWARSANFDVHCVIFDRWGQVLIYGGKTWDWVVPTKFEIYRVFSNFLRYKMLSGLATREALHTKVNSCITTCYCYGFNWGFQYRHY